jgi:hypothetical protein
MQPPLKRTRKAARDVRRVQYAANVAEAVGVVEHGCEIYGLCRGQYSLIDLVEHVLTYTGPADLAISTWTAAGADIDYALRLTKDGRVRSIMWLVDSSFPVRQPGYCKAMRERFGDAAIRVTQNHAKFVLIGNAEWSVVLRTSMNLNENKRLESWELSDDPELFGYLTEVVAEMFAADPTTLDASGANRESRSAFDATTEANRDPGRRLRYIK